MHVAIRPNLDQRNGKAAGVTEHRRIAGTQSVGDRWHPLNPDTVAQMPKMAEEEFWGLIATHVKRRRDGSIDVKRLRDVLVKMPPPKILAFHQRCLTYYFKSYTWPLWAAAYLIHDGAPDDTFAYFRSWLIGQGRDVFTAAMKDPDSLVKVATPEALDDELYHIGSKVFESVAGKRPPDSAFKLPKLNKRLDFNDARAMERAYPKLFRKYGGMYAPTPEDALLERCRKYAGASGRWTSKDIAGFFHRFRPDGQGLAEIYSGVEHGEEISKRLIAAMKVDGTTKGSTLSANNLIPINEKQAVALVKLLCAKIRKLSQEIDDDELAERFVAKQFVIHAGKQRKITQNDYTAEGIEMLCDTAFSLVYESCATASVLDSGIYSLFARGVLSPLAFYIQWPVCADRFQTVDPFKPFFDLWRRGVAWRLTDDKVAEVFTP
jgi:hypothetical protein